MSVTADRVLAKAYEARAHGDLTYATDQCLVVLREDPSHVGALTLLGALSIDAGAAEVAVALLERASAVAPTDLGAAVGLADACDAAGDRVRAEQLFLDALALAPDSVIAWTAWGRFLTFEDRTAESIDALDHAVQVDPTFAEARLALSHALLDGGSLGCAAAAFHEALRLRPDYGARPITLAHQYKSCGRPDRAVRVLEHGLAMLPEDPELRYLHAALTGDWVDERPPDGFIAQHFDRFAPTFDRCLCEGLGYDVPADLIALVSRSVGTDETRRDVLDIGCGTGLCGPLLRPAARRLVGVDLSAGMLDLAAQREVYDELIQSDLVDTMHAAPDAYDLIVAADVCMYFGALDEVFLTAAEALRPGGVFALSIESDESEGHHLRSTGRWTHSVAELRRVAAAAGFHEAIVEPSQLRLELGAPVRGFLAVFMLPESI